LRTGRSVFYSRSRKSLWRKGETSGNVQEVVEVLLDCDGDAVVYRVIPHGPACHTGERTCFHRPLLEGRKDLGFALGQVYATILERLKTLPEGSYVARMHQAGLDRILKKIGEEAGEVIIAAKNGGSRGDPVGGRRTSSFTSSSPWRRRGSPSRTWPRPS
jgi:phosphoribosyl-ATP pyrophosphohydrolase/phosphoribosyl-AMP cyclohydrolase